MTQPKNPDDDGGIVMLPQVSIWRQSPGLDPCTWLRSDETNCRRETRWYVAIDPHDPDGLKVFACDKHLGPLIRLYGRSVPARTADGQLMHAPLDPWCACTSCYSEVSR